MRAVAASVVAGGFIVVGAPASQAVALGSGSVPPGGTQFVPVTPTRLVDTRIGLGAPKRATTVLAVSVAGTAGIPTSGVAAVAINVTVTGSTGGGFLSVTPGGEPTGPTRTSFLNFTKGQVRDQSTIVALDNTGLFHLYASVATEMIVDVTGYFGAAPTAPAASRYVPVTPTRLLDTRVTGAPLTSKATRSIQVTGKAGIPTQDVSGVVVNLTGVNPTGTGYLTAYPGATRPTTSSLNFTARTVRANRAVLGLNGNGRFNLYNSTGTTNIVLDITGYFTTANTGDYYVPLGPTRFDDTRAAQFLSEGEIESEPIAGKDFIPSMRAMDHPVAVVSTLTIIASADAAGYATMWDGGRRPATSDLNYARSTIESNLTLTTVGGAGDISIGHGAGINYILDVLGYFAAPLPSPTASGLWGIDFSNNNAAPAQFSNLSGVTEIADSDTWTDLLRSDGTVYTLLNPADPPTQVPGLTGVTALAGSPESEPIAYALKNDGTVWAWGNGSHGGLGNGSTATTLTPVQVSGLTGIVAIGAAAGAGYAIDGDGNLWAWGDNSEGLLGNGTTTTQTTPVQITTLHNVVAVSGDGDIAEAIEADGTAWHWGRLGGYPAAPDQLTPTQVTSSCPAKALSGGWDSDNTVYIICRDGTSPQLDGSGIVAIVNSTAGGPLELRSDGTVWISGPRGSDQLLGLTGITALGPGHLSYLATTGN